MATLRGYEVWVSSNEIQIEWGDTSSDRANKLPSVAELKALMGQDIPVTYTYCFARCHITASPNLDAAAGASSLSHMFSYGDIPEPPALPACSDLSGILNYNFTRHFPVIPQGAVNMEEAFYSNWEAKKPVSIPSSVRIMTETFYDCSGMSGEMIIRPTSLTSYTDAFNGTSEPIILYGKKSVCEALASTANNGNVSWSAWYDPVPAVTNRGEGSRTTAADLTRMVHNGALAVSSYAPGRMTYDVGDIVREDEWKALVDAAKTIDPTITYSSHYANLNKIEAAFDSAF